MMFHNWLEELFSDPEDEWSDGWTTEDHRVAKLVGVPLYLHLTDRLRTLGIKSKVWNDVIVRMIDTHDQGMSTGKQLCVTMVYIKRPGVQQMEIVDDSVIAAIPDWN